MSSQRSSDLWPMAAISLVVIALSALTACETPADPSSQQPATLEFDAGDSIEVSGLGALVEVTATVKDQWGVPMPGYPLVWAAEDTTVLQPLDGGVFRAVANGVTRVVVRAEGRVARGRPRGGPPGELRAEIAVRVRQRPARIILTVADGTLWALGQRRRVFAHVLDSSGSPLADPASLAWSSSDPKVAAVDSVGMVVALADGTSQLTATADSVTTSIAIRVSASIRLLVCVAHAGTSTDRCADVRVLSRDPFPSP